MKVLVLGYYDRQNIGDDMFKFIFTNYFNENWPHHELVIKNTDDVESINNDVGLVVVGGGDLINKYFMDKINSLIDPIKDSIPIYAIGVGFPYPKLIDEGILDCFDYIIHRNKCDSNKLIEKYGKNRSQYYPDLGFLLENYSSNTISTDLFKEIGNDYDPGIGSYKIKNIGVFLTKTIYNINDPQAYDKIVDDFSFFLAKIAELKQKPPVSKKFKCFNMAPKYCIYLLSCCNSNGNEKEDDRKINCDIYNRIKKYNNFANVKLVNFPMNIPEIIPIFKKFHMTICMRFHAHIFSILAGVPFLSVYSSRKVNCLLDASNLKQYSVEMEINKDFLYPTKVEVYSLVQKFFLIEQQHKTYKSLLCKLNANNTKKLGEMTNVLDNLIYTPIKYTGPETNAFIKKVKVHVIDIATKIIKYLRPDLDKETINQWATRLSDPNNCNPARLTIKYLILTNIDLKFADLPDNLDKQNSMKTETTKHINFLVELIVFNLTGQRDTDFNYGLKQQINTNDYHLFESVKWILCEIYRQKHNESNNDTTFNPILIKYRKFDMKYFFQHDLRGFHRSGWSYVVHHLEKFHNPNGPIFDSFLDKTFGWNYDFYVDSGVLPFKKSWVGVFHHTFNETYSVNNLTEIFKRPLFITSLATCKGIYVLSDYLKQWLVDKFDEIGFPNIKVNVLLHPTEIVDNTFKWNKFINNNDRKLVQIGAWYRNSYAIYSLCDLKHLKKAALKGRNMDNYYLKDGQLDEIKDSLIKLGENWSLDWISSSGCGNVSRNLSHEESKNRRHKYLQGLIEDLDKRHNQVEIIDCLTNKQYDQLLTCNAVFLNLVDASAVNTVIECIVRATPLVINRLPAVEEYLGEDYPLFYDNLKEATEILNNLDKLKQGHEYLAQKDVTRFHINRFIKDLIKSEIFISL
tara:strand:+ start:19951 stop:22680 length:2730 start_codon:yes stop_codon:yes gene_type:complete